MLHTDARRREGSDEDHLPDAVGAGAGAPEPPSIVGVSVVIGPDLHDDGRLHAVLGPGPVRRPLLLRPTERDQHIGVEADARIGAVRKPRQSTAHGDIGPAREGARQPGRQQIDQLFVQDVLRHHLLFGCEEHDGFVDGAHATDS